MACCNCLQCCPLNAFFDTGISLDKAAGQRPAGVQDLCAHATSTVHLKSAVRHALLALHNVVTEWHAIWLNSLRCDSLFLVAFQSVRSNENIVKCCYSRLMVPNVQEP